MKFTIRYHGKKSKEIILFSDERTNEAVANDCAKQLTKRYKYYLDKNNNSKTEKQLKRYELGQKFLIMAALESMR